jgi:hypothetical protein
MKDKMTGTCRKHQEETWNAYKILAGKPAYKQQCKQILRKWVMGMWRGMKWLRLGQYIGLLW